MFSAGKNEQGNGTLIQVSATMRQIKHRHENISLGSQLTGMALTRDCKSLILGTESGDLIKWAIEDKSGSEVGNLGNGVVNMVD